MPDTKWKPRPIIIPQLIEALQKKWRELDMDAINRLVESMPNRNNAVIEAKGGNIKY
jgi:hypothetical protein